MVRKRYAIGNGIPTNIKPCAKSDSASSAKNHFKRLLTFLKNIVRFNNVMYMCNQLKQIINPTLTSLLHRRGSNVQAIDCIIFQ